MILSDREVRAARERRLIWISDCPPRSNQRWSSTTLDLTLAEEIRPWQPQGGAGADVIIDPSDPEFNSNQLINQRTQAVSRDGEGYVIQPHSLVLGWTQEQIKLPNALRIGARVEGKSSLARIGSASMSPPPPFTLVSGKSSTILNFSGRQSGWKSGTSAH